MAEQTPENDALAVIRARWAGEPTGRYSTETERRDYADVRYLLDRLAAVEALADEIDRHDFTPECADDRCRQCLTAEAIHAAVTDRVTSPGQEGS